jgi:FkbM family methyltransferase
MKYIFDKLKQYGIRTFIKFAFGELKVILWNRYVYGSYSQSKEDLIIDKMIGYKKTGFYVDVGAFDPLRFSNTMRFYKRGWRGINIEPNTFHWHTFMAKRNRDINLNIGIAQKKGNLTYYHMDPATLSTFVKKQIAEYERQGFTLLGTRKISVLPLCDVLEKFAKGKTIDFMSIDVEGFEIDVLKSNDWKKFRPQFLCIESTKADRKNRYTYHTIVSYLYTICYQLIEDNGLNTFYKDMHRKRSV